MSRQSRAASLLVVMCMVCASSCSTSPPESTGAGGTGEPQAAARSARYEDLVSLFREWRAFQRPLVVEGAPDYSAAAMAKQAGDVGAWQARLKAIDPSSWPVPQQVDYHVVRAEMNGLEFDHRVLKPWASNPAFYVTVFPNESDQPAREGPLAYGAVELWKYTFPLNDQAMAEITPGMRAIPVLLSRAQASLVGNGKDLWAYGVKSIEGQGRALADLSSKLQAGELQDAVGKAKAATDAFAAWLNQQLPSKTGPSGIGVENYDWYLANVQLLPYTWHDEVVLMERELARAWASLSLEESRNAGLPPQDPITTAAEYDRRFTAAVTAYIAFLRDRNIMTVRDYFEPALRARGRFNPGPREFFSETDYRDPMVMRTHGYHWFDKGRMVNLPYESPIRKEPLLYNIFNTRTEGLATAWEEMMLQAGMFDRQPRSRELVYILLAQRAARAMGDLRMHANQATLEQAAEFASARTPRGWLGLNGTTVRHEQHLYLQQPGYGVCYVIGKLEIDALLADRKRQLGDAFALADFVDALDAAGQIPMTLIRWEMTGEMTPELKRILTP